MNLQPPDTPKRVCPETGFECDCNGKCNMKEIMTKKLIYAYTETKYENYPAVLNISQSVDGGAITLMVREAESGGNKWAQIELSMTDCKAIADAMINFEEQGK